MVDAITCRTACQAIDAGSAGSVIQVSGPNMGAVSQVVLLGRRGAKDDKRMPALPVSAQAAVVTIPPGARTGPVRAITTKGVESVKSSRRLLVGSRGSGPRSGPMLQARSDIRRVVAGMVPTVSFFNKSSNPQDVAVDVIRDGAIVAHYEVASVPGRGVHSVSWADAQQSAEGRYEWRVWTREQSQALAASAPSQAGGGQSAPDPKVTAASSAGGPSFSIVRHVYPIQGAHQYGMGAGRFGNDRGDHSHQGQDVFAKCGTPLVAVTGGEIQFSGQQSAAGNYIVLNGDDGFDYAYMHMREPSKLKKGDKVGAGQFVGRVGDTGRASGCHLHFEIWTAPGWYEGGSPIDPLDKLRSWED